MKLVCARYPTHDAEYELGQLFLFFDCVLTCLHSSLLMFTLSCWLASQVHEKHLSWFKITSTEGSVAEMQFLYNNLLLE